MTMISQNENYISSVISVNSVATLVKVTIAQRKGSRPLLSSAVLVRLGA